MQFRRCLTKLFYWPAKPSLQQSNMLAHGLYSPSLALLGLALLGLALLGLALPDQT